MLRRNEKSDKVYSKIKEKVGNNFKKDEVNHYKWRHSILDFMLLELALRLRTAKSSIRIVVSFNNVNVNGQN